MVLKNKSVIIILSLVVILIVVPTSSVFAQTGIASQITDLVATAGDGDGTVTLTWTAPNLNGGTFEHYGIPYDGTSVVVHDYSTTSKTISGLLNNTPYTFKIQAQTLEGRGLISNAVTVTVVSPFPTTPNFTFTFERTGLNSSLDLSTRGIVDDVDTFEDLEILICNISSSVNIVSGLSASGINKLEESNCREVTDKNAVVFNLFVTDGIPQIVTYIVTDSDDISSKGRITFTHVPSQITDLKATAGDGTVTLTWTAPNLYGGTFSHYGIPYDGTSVVVTDHSTTSKTISGLLNNTPYTFKIQVQTLEGRRGLISNAVTVTPTAPVTPLAITVTPFVKTDGGVIATVSIVSPQCVSKVGSIVAFGNQIVGQTSDEEGLDISNIGNMPSNIFLKGTDWIDDTDRSVMDIGQTRYSGTESLDFQDKTQLSNSNVLFNDNLESDVTDIVYLQLSLDLLVTGFTGTATQTITVVTSCDP